MSDRPGVVLEAIAYVISKRRQMLDALCELGYPNAYEIEPRRVKEHVDMLLNGLGATIGTHDDPFVLVSAEGRPIATYYIETMDGRCHVRLSGSEEFLAAYAQAALRDDGSTVH